MSESILTGQTSNPDGSTMLYHWADAKLVGRYLQTMAIPAKWKHVIPGLGAKRGVCFAYDPETWWTHEVDRVCLVIDRTKLTTDILDLPGQAVFDFATYSGLSKSAKAAGASEVERAQPDEAFVLGGIALAGLVVKILTPGTSAVASVVKKAQALGFTVEEIESEHVAHIKKRDAVPSLEALRKQVPVSDLDAALRVEALKKHPDRADQVDAKIAELDTEKKYQILFGYLTS